MKRRSILKTITAAAIAQVMLAISLPAVPAASIDQPVILNNIVLFAQSAPVAESNFMEDRAEAITTMCSDTSTIHSLSGYINEISYGALQVNSYFPQMKDGRILPYQLSADAADYSSCQQIAIEILQNITIPEDIPLDGNSDGIVDNIIFIVDGKAVDMSSPLWPRAFSMAGMQLNGLPVHRVNIQNSSQIFENQITGAEGVLCHEFLHSLGYPDLYRNERSGTPIGQWDIMASDSVFLQYPLAYQRAVISGWLDAKEITEGGTYSLSPVSSASGDRLYLLKTPLSDTEFFAVEYRQQGARYSDEIDVKIYGTGLVVYRVNTEAEGNFNGDQDEIYVFRPGETGLNAGEGDLFQSNYGGENAPDTVGSLDWDADITDGALVYSNGTNSGICIRDIVMDAQTLTFTVDFADTSGVSVWESIGSEPLGKDKPYQMAAAPDGTVYLIAANDSDARLYRYDGSSLLAYGEPVGSGRAMDMNQPALAFCGNTPYVLYQDKDFCLHLCRYDASDGGWTQVYQGQETAQYAALTADAGKVYFTYTTGSFPYALHAVCFDTDTGRVDVIGETIADNGCQMSIAVLNGGPLIAYRDLNDGNIAKLAVYHDGAWKIHQVSQSPCGMVSMTADGAAAWIAPSGQGNAVCRFSDGELTAYPLPESIPQNVFSVIPFAAKGTCYLAVNTQNPDEAAVYRLNGTDWEMTGDTLAMELVNSLSMVYSDQTLYCSYLTNQGTPMIRRLSLGSENPVAGDVNGDGRCDVSDVVLLQKWLLGVPDAAIVDWRAGDLCADHRLDVFDLGLLKQMLLAK